MKCQIPSHVLAPGPTSEFIPVADHRETNRAGLGYGILRALGAHEKLSWNALAIIAKWSALYGATHKVTPNEANLLAIPFHLRIGPRFSAPEAATNARCYPGRKNRPSYAVIYGEVWIKQSWPDLCKALSGEI